MSRRNLKKRIEKVESIVSEMKESDLLKNKTSPIDIVNKNMSIIRKPNKLKVFGREALRKEIVAKLLQTPASGSSSESSTSECYSVVGIHGITGCGKTTFARYIRDYIKDDNDMKGKNPFDVIWCIHVSETLNVAAIFDEMLKDITQVEHSDSEDLPVKKKDSEDPPVKKEDSEKLKRKLKKALTGKCFLLILDDFWVKNRRDHELMDLVSPLNAGKKGSKILVTAQTEKPCIALGDSDPIKMPDLDDHQYLEMFMHCALGGTDVPQDEFIPYGREIAKKLKGSPIAAVTVGGRLGITRDVKAWKRAARDVELNTTRGALWWSYQRIDADIRRCFEYCNIFRKRHMLRTDELIDLWIAQGFVTSPDERVSVEDVALGYVQELVSCSFLQAEDYNGCFTIHDLLRDLTQTLAGRECFIFNNGHSGGVSQGQIIPDIPWDVCHLLVENYDEALLISDEILELEHLRTLIIFSVGQDTRVDQKVIESISKRLRKLRVLAVGFPDNDGALTPERPYKLSFPESISQLMHLRYLAFRPRLLYMLEMPTTVTKLYHMQLLDVSCATGVAVKIPNIGRLVSIRTMSRFTVRQEEGCEVKQLMRLNKLGGEMTISGLENVKSGKDAVEANLAAKRHITQLSLDWVKGADHKLKQRYLRDFVLPRSGLGT